MKFEIVYLSISRRFADGHKLEFWCFVHDISFAWKLSSSSKCYLKWLNAACCFAYPEIFCISENVMHYNCHFLKLIERSFIKLGSKIFVREKMKNLEKSGNFTDTSQNNFVYIFIIGNNAFQIKYSLRISPQKKIGELLKILYWKPRKVRGKHTCKVWITMILIILRLHKESQLFNFLWDQ